MKFGVIVADPPWRFGLTFVPRKNNHNRKNSLDYQTMSDSDLIDLFQGNVKQLADDNAIMALWVTANHLKLGIELLEVSGFTLKQTYAWDKQNFGLGTLFRNCHEIALIGTKGKMCANRKSKSERSFISERSGKHSQKPLALQRSLERMYPYEYKLELFARSDASGWICLGNEIDGKDIFDSTREWMNIR